MRRFSLAGVWAIFLCVTSVFGTCDSLPTKCVAHTARGSIVGHYSTQEAAVCEWLGIPYGAAPVAQLRFAPPVKAALNGSFTADQFGADCPQNPARLFAYPNATAQYTKLFTSFSSTTSTNHTQSEDCLSLNVWSKPTKRGKKAPVLVWIHGGRHNSGSSNTPFYHGAKFANGQDAVFVTFNFRMNIFGFPGAPEATQNLGLLDQYLAVQWVHENIASFGGDPGRITIIGQSSGAVAVSNWAYAFKDKPLVAGAMSHSGNQFSFPTNTLELAAKNWHNVTGTLGCGTSGSTLACMRSSNITFQAILNAVRLVPAVPQNSLARSQPQFQVTQDNVTFFSNAEYLSRVKSGNIARIPYFQINGNHESGFYRISALSQGNTLPESDWQVFEQETFTCPSAVEAYWRTKAGIPSYRSRNMADWENTRLYNPPSSGAYHGVEIYSVTGNSELVSGIAPVEAQVELTEIMQSAWAAFASDPADGLEKLGWPKYIAGEDTLIELGSNNTAAVDFVDTALFDAPCPGRGLDFWDSSIPV